MGENLYYELDAVFPFPLTDKQVDALRALTEHEGWNVLMGIAGSDAQGALLGALDTTATSSERDQNTASLKAIAWFMTLKERLGKALDGAEPVPQEALATLTLDEATEQGVPSVLDCFLSRMRK